MNKKRILSLFLLVGLVVVAAAGSWVAGSNIRSPAEMAARTAPPLPSPILVPVERRVLSTKVVTRGTARYRLPRSVSIVPSTLKPNLGVISKLPKPATRLNEGDVIFVASGRPVFALLGEIPAYRDFVPGVSGGDVRQLKNSLKRLGIDPGPNKDLYDEDTATAVASWYSSSGWRPLGPTTEQRAIIRALEKELAAANSTKLAAADALAAAPAIVDTAKAKAESANKSAAANVVAKRMALDRTKVDQSTTDQEQFKAELDLELAEAAAHATLLTGKVEVQAAINAQRTASREAKIT
ncbi:MAG: peptidoglycan-binding domain-containing protein, partial [Desulfobulbia bacterium]